MSTSATTEASKTAAFIGVGGLLVAIAAATLGYLAFHQNPIVAATTLGIGLFVTVWNIFLAIALIASLFADTPPK